MRSAFNALLAALLLAAAAPHRAFAQVDGSEGASEQEYAQPEQASEEESAPFEASEEEAQASDETELDTVSEFQEITLEESDEAEQVAEYEAAAEGDQACLCRDQGGVATYIRKSEVQKRGIKGCECGPPKAKAVPECGDTRPSAFATCTCLKTGSTICYPQRPPQGCTIDFLKSKGCLAGKQEEMKATPGTKVYGKGGGFGWGYFQKPPEVDLRSSNERVLRLTQQCKGMGMGQSACNDFIKKSPDQQESIVKQYAKAEAESRRVAAERERQARAKAAEDERARIQALRKQRPELTPEQAKKLLEPKMRGRQSPIDQRYLPNAPAAPEGKPVERKGNTNFFGIGGAPGKPGAGAPGGKAPGGPAPGAAAPRSAPPQQKSPQTRTQAQRTKMAPMPLPETMRGPSPGPIPGQASPPSARALNSPAPAQRQAAPRGGTTTVYPQGVAPRASTSQQRAPTQQRRHPPSNVRTMAGPGTAPAPQAQRAPTQRAPQAPPRQAQGPAPQAKSASPAPQAQTAPQPRAAVPRPRSTQSSPSPARAQSSPSPSRSPSRSTSGTRRVSMEEEISDEAYEGEESTPVSEEEESSAEDAMPAAEGTEGASDLESAEAGQMELEKRMQEEVEKRRRLLEAPAPK